MDGFQTFNSLNRIPLYIVLEKSEYQESQLAIRSPRLGGLPSVEYQFDIKKKVNLWYSVW